METKRFKQEGDTAESLKHIFYFHIQSTPFIHLMTLNRVKLGQLLFIKYLTSVVFLTFLAKSLIWNKITYPALNWLNLSELVENEPLKSTWKKR